MDKSMRTTSWLVAILWLSACGSDEPLEPTQPEVIGEVAQALSTRPLWVPVNNGAVPAGSTGSIFSSWVAVDATLPLLTYANVGGSSSVSWSLGNAWSSSSALTLPDHNLATRGAVDPNRPGRAYVLVQHGEHYPFITSLFRTDSAGVAWTQLPDPNLIGAPLALAVAPGNANVIYSAAIEHDVGLVLTKSTDGGASFQPQNQFMLDCCSELVALSAQNVYGVAAPNAYNRGSFALKHTSDGETWSTLRENVGHFAIDLRKPALIYAALTDVESGLIKSADGGLTWSSPLAQFASASVSLVEVSPVDGRVYVGVRGGSDVYGDAQTIYVSTDGGASFSLANEGLSGQRISSVTPHPTLPCVAFAATNTGGVFRTTRAGGHCP